MVADQAVNIFFNQLESSVWVFLSFGIAQILGKKVKMSGALSVLSALDHVKEEKETGNFARWRNVGRGLRIGSPIAF